MARMQVDAIKPIVEEKGFVTVQEPCCGSGAMVVALADVMREEDINYQQHMHVTAIDIDSQCVHMAYLQLSLLHIPAVVIRGDTLRMEFSECWYTPAHHLGFWDNKLRRAANAKITAPVSEQPEPPAPVPPAVKPGIQLSLF